MEFCLTMCLGAVVGASVMALLCVWSSERELKKLDEELDRELADLCIKNLVRTTVWEEVIQCKREIVRYVDSKMAEKDKQEETGEEEEA